MTILTLAEYKNIKNRTKTEGDDEIQLVINSVNSIIESFLNRTVSLESGIEEFFSLDYETDVIFPKKWPIATVITIKEIPLNSPIDDLSIYPALVHDVDYLVDEDRIYRIGGKSWQTGPKRIFIEYSAGYASIPEGLKMAAIDLADYFIKSQYLQSRTAAGTTITNLVSDIAKVPAHVRMVLNSFK